MQGGDLSFALPVVYPARRKITLSGRFFVSTNRSRRISDGLSPELRGILRSHVLRAGHSPHGTVTALLDVRACALPIIESA